MPTHIYTVTCLTIGVHESGVRIIKHSRCWGWFPLLKDAKGCVRENDGDIYENGSYTHAVIEKMSWGSLAMSDKEWWYQAKLLKHGGDYSVSRIKKPKFLDGVVHFGMG